MSFTHKNRVKENLPAKVDCGSTSCAAPCGIVKPPFCRYRFFCIRKLFCNDQVMDNERYSVSTLIIYCGMVVVQNSTIRISVLTISIYSGITVGRLCHAIPVSDCQTRRVDAAIGCEIHIQPGVQICELF